MEHDWHASHEMFNTDERPVTYPCIGSEGQTYRFLDEWELVYGRSRRTGCTSWQDADGARRSLLK